MWRTNLLTLMSAFHPKLTLKTRPGGRRLGLRGDRVTQARLKLSKALCPQRFAAPPGAACVQERPQAQRAHRPVAEQVMDEQVFADAQNEHQRDGCCDLREQPEAPYQCHHHHCPAKTGVDLESLELKRFIL